MFSLVYGYLNKHHIKHFITVEPSSKSSFTIITTIFWEGNTCTCDVSRVLGTNTSVWWNNNQAGWRCEIGIYRSLFLQLFSTARYWIKSTVTVHNHSTDLLGWFYFSGPALWVLYSYNCTKFSRFFVDMDIYKLHCWATSSSVRTIVPFYFVVRACKRVRLNVCEYFIKK